MQIFRSTLAQGASWHAWPDAAGAVKWDLPQTDRPGAWRTALPHTSTKPHGNGLHGAGFQSLAYWLGPENYILESDESAEKENDWCAQDDIIEDIQVCRKGRLAKRLAMADGFWPTLSLQCVGLLAAFPTYYNYEGRYDDRAREESILHPQYHIFQDAVIAYSWQEAIAQTHDFLCGDNAVDKEALSHKLHHIGVQGGAHRQSIGRCEEYHHHSVAMSQAMQAISLLQYFIVDEPVDGYSITRQIITKTADALAATGAEQFRLMLTDPTYDLTSGVGPLLCGLPFLPEKHLNNASPEDVTRRAAMLKMGEFVAAGLGIVPEYRTSMEKNRPLDMVFQRLVAHHKDLTL